MEIVLLKERTEFIPTLAAWHHQEWAYLHDHDSVERRIAEFQEELQANGIPRTFVAISGNGVIGSASLLPQDMDTRTDLSPWLASVYVVPEQRKQGIGSALVKRVVQEGAALGFRTLYLYTPDRPQFYASLGWSTVEKVQYHGTSVTIMKIEL
ncbi:MAG: N-acetyltransferase [Candidatus Abyssobacteria bacterium SURF_5]|uniref:N-acetyltransferase n=1 Tax=Abyssobacteria bacterium (strain SURF_5) TaxID=2093360 RepID=A0A3A4NG95_ABYX5|nr:MAG: N-acetyltransferase [Candidatus Abyssubacteria bacterium SURF_5]